MTETIREFLNKHNLNVEKVTWTHLGDKELDDPVILYDKNNLIPDILYVPARGNGKVLTTIRLLLKQLSREPKLESPYKYRDAIHKSVTDINVGIKPELVGFKPQPDIFARFIKGEANIKQLTEYLNSSIQWQIKNTISKENKDGI